MSQERRSWAEQKKRWTEIHEQVVVYKVQNPPAAERLLEKSLEIAKEIRSESLIALTLQELSDIESAQGKTIEAAEHKKALENRSKVGDMTKFAIQIGSLLICVGIVLFLLIYLVFSKETLNSFQKILSKKN
ncbi:MAG: tetratricopeptide repeat protein [Leptolyngbya sp.]|nr:tetratricopeptide repeat protein [Candidatus Melainabacteria bacterium]